MRGMDETEVADQAQDAPEVEVSLIEKLKNDAGLMAHIRGEEAPEVDPVAEETPADDAADDTVEDAEGDEPEGEQAEEESEVEAEAEPAEPEAWYDARDEQYAATYGMSAYDLSQFGTRDEFLKTLRYIDRQVSRAPVKESEPPKEPAAKQVPGPFNADGSVNKEWCDEQGLDEFQVASLERESAREKKLAELAQQNEWVQQQYIQQQQQAYETALHDAIDKLARPELYGATVVNGTPKRIAEAELSRRRAISSTIAALAERYEQRNEPVPPLDILVRKAEAIEFGDQVEQIVAKRAKAEQKQRTEKVLKQSTRRRPVASSAGATGKSKAAFADPESDEAILAGSSFKQFFDERGYSNSNY
jgi:hypothetical protein